MNEDRLFEARDGREPFRFDQEVTRVFPDMLRRSIPGYAASIEAIGALSARFVRAGTNCYDLGCSLGAASLAMRQGARSDDVVVIGIDTSEAMVERCRDMVGDDPAIRIELADMRDVDYQNASMIALNYTLQFIPVEDRDALIQKLYDGLNPGGLLVLSEKVIDNDPQLEQLLVDLHHEHKRRNDYSELEISRKRTALENVLVPERVDDHKARLTKAGFQHIAVWLRYFNFVSLIAIKAR